MSKRTGAAVLIAVLAVVMGAAVYALSTECYPDEPGSDIEHCMPRIVHAVKG